MKLRPERQVAWNKLFGNPMSVSVVIMDIENQGFRKLPEEEVSEYWTKLFGNKGKDESIALLKRVVRKKEYDFKVFREFQAKREFKIRYDDFLSHD